MKRIVILAIAAVAMFSMVATAGAAELKVSGKFHTNFGVFNNFGTFEEDGNGGQSTQFETRFRPAFDYVASEALSAHLELEIGDVDWGNGAFDFGGDNTDAIELRRMYMDFIIPNTQANVRLGLQGIALPNSFGGNAVWDSENAAGAVVSTPITDTVSLTAGFVRTIKGTDDAANVAQQDAYADMWFAAVPVKAEGFTVTPYAAFVNASARGFNLMAGNAAFAGLLAPAAAANADDDVSIWYGGAAFEMSMLDPFILKANAVYGSLDADDDENERSGWSANAALDYKGFDFMTPELVVGYTSGEDDDASDGSERLPAFDPFMTLGSYWLGSGDFVDTNDDETNLGYWLVGVNLKDISFIEKLTHTIGVYYIQGTNDDDVVAAGATNGAINNKTLGEDDNVWEVSLTSHYQIYDELSAYLDLAYINPDYDSDRNIDDEAGSAMVFGLVYKF